LIRPSAERFQADLFKARNPLGLIPKAALNARLKLELSEKPFRSAIVVRLISGPGSLTISARARSRRCRLMKQAGESPIRSKRL
jgi:hypothetical protein